MRGYFQHSTATPTGFRPWNFGMQGLGRARVPVRRMAHLGRLGATLPFASQFQPQLDSLAAQIAQAQTQINATNQLILQGNAAGLDMTTEASNNMQAQNNVTSATNDLNLIYRALFGTVAPGLSGLGRMRGMGQFDPATLATVAGVTAAIAIVAGLVYAAIQWASSANTSAQAKLTQQNTAASSAASQQSLLNQAAAQYAAGNTTAGDQLTALAQSAGATAAAAAGSATVSGNWFTDPTQSLIGGIPNWGLLAAAGFVVFLGPDILTTIRKAL